MIMISKSAYRYMHTHWYQVPVPLAVLPGTSTGTGTWYGSFYTSVMKPVPGTWYDFHVYLPSLFYFDESTGIVLVVPIILPAFISITTNIIGGGGGVAHPILTFHALTSTNQSIIRSIVFEVLLHVGSLDKNNSNTNDSISICSHHHTALTNYHPLHDDQ